MPQRRAVAAQQQPGWRGPVLRPSPRTAGIRAISATCC